MMRDQENQKCHVAESGKHEPDFNRAAFDTYLNADTAVFITWCIHCGKSATFRVHENEVSWFESGEGKR